MFSFVRLVMVKVSPFTAIKLQDTTLTNNQYNECWETFCQLFTQYVCGGLWWLEWEWPPGAHIFEYSVPSWWNHLERIGRCVTRVGFEGLSPGQGQSSLCILPLDQDVRSVCLLAHGHASYYDGETWSEPPMKCFPLQAALVTVFCHSNNNKKKKSN